MSSSDDEQSPPHSPTTAGKPDFSGITQTIGRQLHNIAIFFAPPPQQPCSSSTPDDDSGDTSPSGSDSYRGMKNDLAEIGGSFKTSLSLSGISKLASNLLPFDKRDDPEEVKHAGITDEIINFVREVSVRPECWTDFPLSLRHKDFNLSNIHKDHGAAMEQLVPSLTDLRHKIEGFMSEKEFWMIYFILLLPRLNQADYALLSTPKMVELRNILLQKLRNKNKAMKDENEHVDEESDIDDEDNYLSAGIKPAQSSNPSSSSEMGDWVRLNDAPKGEESRKRRSESEESSDWLDVHDVDL